MPAVSPLRALHLVAADVEEVIGKQRSHFTNESVQEFVNGLARGVHGGIEDAPFTLDLVWAGRAGQLRISDQPASRVAGDIELGDHADAAVAGVGDHVAYLVLRVVESIGAEFMQLGEALAFDAETLIV